MVLEVFSKPWAVDETALSLVHAARVIGVACWRATSPISLEAFSR
tara:strand:+ start:1237 stop:1371 length:135 start_codon:yes stop_codon:yes gene_type:complete